MLGMKLWILNSIKNIEVCNGRDCVHKINSILLTSGETEHIKKKQIIYLIGRCILFFSMVEGVRARKTLRVKGRIKKK